MRAGWELKKLNQIGKVFNGNSINEKVKKDKYTDVEDGLPFIATKDVGFDSSIDYQNGVRIPFNETNQFKIAPSNTPLICAEGGSAGRKISFTNQDVCFGNKLFAFAPNKNVDSKYVFYYYFSSSFQKHFTTEMAGIIGGVSMNKFKDIEIPLPSLPEQQRIVALLDEAFAAIAKAKANAEQNLKNAKELFESYLQGVFENKGEGWEEKKLGEVYSFKNGINFDKTQKNGNGILTLDVLNMYCEGLKVDISKLYRIDKKVKEDCILKNEDILIVRSSVKEEGVAWATYFEEGDEQITYCGFIIRGRPFEKLNAKYVVYFLRTEGVRSELIKKATKSTITNINQSNLSEIIIPIPPIKEQQTIVLQLDTLRAETQKLEAVYQQKLADLEELKKSILQKAFAGELTDKSIAS
jgi:type I restriction enzyme, S subunit